MTYSDKLKSPKWQKKRLEILQLFNFCCLHCGDKENELHVHHKYYLKGNDVWDYPVDCFTVLCKDCHESEESALKVNSEKLIQSLRASGADSWCINFLSETILDANNEYKSPFYLADIIQRMFTLERNGINYFEKIDADFTLLLDKIKKENG